jgi:Putative amidoligase enzyme
VHLDAADFMPAQDANTELARLIALRDLMTFYLSFEDVLLALLPQSRRTNNYCKAFKSAYAWEDIAHAGSRKTLESVWYKAAELDEVARRKVNKYDSSRYRGVNFHSLFNGGHLEIRYHSGTLNPRKVLEWVNLHGRIMDRIADRTLHFANALYTLTLTEKITLFFSLLELPADSQKYFQARIEKFTLGLSDEAMLCAA